MEVDEAAEKIMEILISDETNDNGKRNSYDRSLHGSTKERARFGIESVKAPDVVDHENAIRETQKFLLSMNETQAGESEPLMTCTACDSTFKPYKHGSTSPKICSKCLQYRAKIGREKNKILREMAGDSSEGSHASPSGRIAAPAPELPGASMPDEPAERPAAPVKTCDAGVRIELVFADRDASLLAQLLTLAEKERRAPDQQILRILEEQFL